MSRPYKSEHLTEMNKQWQSKQVAPATVNRELSCFKRMYSMAIRWGKVKDNPARAVQKMRQPENGRCLTAEEKERLSGLSTLMMLSGGNHGNADALRSS